MVIIRYFFEKRLKYCADLKIFTPNIDKNHMKFSNAFKGCRAGELA